MLNIFSRRDAGTQRPARGALRRYASVSLSMLMLTGCTGLARCTAVFTAENFGADWVIGQIGFDGKPGACWVLHNVSVVNEPSSDGIHWLGRDGDLVHVAGWIDRVQVSGGNFERAAKQLGVDLTRCTDVR